MTLIPNPQFIGVNSFGDIVGSTESDISDSWGWVAYSPSYEVILLDELLSAEQRAARWTITDGVDINDDGQITGKFVIGDLGAVPLLYHTFLYTPGQGVEALPEPDGCTWSDPRTINDMGQVAGGTGATGTGTSLFVWTPEATPSLQVLTTGGSNPRSARINDFGQVAYTATISSVNYHAFRYAPGDPAKNLDLGVIGVFGSGAASRSQSTVYGINICGQVVGQSSSKAGYRAFRYTDGVGMLDLGVLDKGVWNESGASSVNDDGQVVGWSFYQDASTRNVIHRPMLYTDTTRMVALWPLISNPPTGIFTENDMGLAAHGMKIFNPADGKTFGWIAGWVKGQMYILTPDR